MIAGLGYNAAKPNARVPETDNLDWQDMAQKRANLEKTKVEIANLKKPKEKDRSGKDKDFSDVFSISAAGAFQPDIEFLNNIKTDIGNFAVDNMDAINAGDAEVQMQLSQQLDKYKVMFEQSKETKSKYAELEAKRMEGGYLNLDEPVVNIFDDNLTIQSKDAQGNIVPKNASVKNAQSFEDYQNAYLARQSEFDKPFKENPIEQQITKSWNLLTDPKVTEVETANGKTQVLTEVTPDEARYRLQNLWNSNRDFQRQAEYDYKQALKNTPDAVVGITGKAVKDMKDAREFVVESQVPVISRKDVKIEGGSGGDSAGSLAMKNVLTNNNQGHTMGFSMSDAKGDIVEYNTPAAMRLSLVPSDVNISTGGGMFNKETGEEMKGGASVKATVGEIALAPVYKNVPKVMGLDINGRPVMAEELDAKKKKGEVEYKVIYTGETKEGEFIYGDISQVESSLFSKESPITDKAAFSKSLDEMKAEAKRLNGESQKKNEAKTIATKIQSTKDPKKFKITYTDGTSAIITE